MCFAKRTHNLMILFRKTDTGKIRYAKKRYAKNIYLRAQMSKNSWAKALAPGHMGLGPGPGVQSQSFGP